MYSTGGELNLHPLDVQSNALTTELHPYLSQLDYHRQRAQDVSRFILSAVCSTKAFRPRRSHHYTHTALTHMWATPQCHSLFTHTHTLPHTHTRTRTHQSRQARLSCISGNVSEHSELFQQSMIIYPLIHTPSH